LILIDFGAVKQITTQVVSPQRKTKFTVAIGTPGYVPSEQAQGNPKLSSDVYAVGIIGIQALTGLLPEQLLKDADTDEIVWRHQARVSSELADILDKMVRYDFRQRYPSATEALQAVRELKNPLCHSRIAGCPLTKKSLRLFQKIRKNLVQDCTKL
jgi:serine/threonine protein kinase